MFHDICDKRSHSNSLGRFFYILASNEKRNADWDRSLYGAKSVSFSRQSLLCASSARVILLCDVGRLIGIRQVGQVHDEDSSNLQQERGRLGGHARCMRRSQKGWDRDWKGSCFISQFDTNRWSGWLCRSLLACYPFWPEVTDQYIILPIGWRWLPIQPCQKKCSEIFPLLKGLRLPTCSRYE